MPWERRHRRGLNSLGLLVPVIAVIVTLAIIAGFSYLSMIVPSSLHH